MRASWGLALAMGLLGAASACADGAAPSANAAAPANAITTAVNVAEATANQVASQAEAAELAGARALIERIYAQYRDGAPAVSPPFTPELTAAIRRTSGMEGGGLDHDPFCACQDHENFSHRIETLERTDEGARARVAIRNMGEARTIVIRLANQGGSWLVADVGEGADSLLNAG